MAEAKRPLSKGGPGWTKRLGSARVQARNWRFMAFGALGLAIGLSFQIAVLSDLACHALCR